MASIKSQNGPQALLFDVFGTVVDWRNSIADSLSRAATASTGHHDSSSNNNVALSAYERLAKMNRADWLRFAADWRQRYYVFTRSQAAATAVEAGAQQTQQSKTIEDFFHESLHGLLAQWGLDGVWSAEEVQQLSSSWRRLRPWADTVAGLHLLNGGGVSTCTLSNGSVQLLRDMADFARLPWTHVFSAELFGTYKPNPRVYLGAAERLGLAPSQCAMVAAHLGDLRAAKDCGMFIVYVERPLEESWDEAQVAQAKQDGWVDVWVEHDEEQMRTGAGGFVEVAKRLGLQ